jgi:hypothetical protein
VAAGGRNRRAARAQLDRGRRALSITNVQYIRLGE